MVHRFSKRKVETIWGDVMEEKKINFLRMKLHKERDVVIGYYDVTKQQIRYMLSDILNKPMEECHIKDLNYEEICKSFDFLRALIKGARNGEGRRIPKTVRKYKEYRKTA